ncbi:flavin reductase family protein [Paraburkholderia adhaesiva]|uniref:flavin reductase family protein n=1 Tax=Paraburkholderia adhaesiva TaxID=2883244 RepID=UPI001F44DD99|nr:flavin reductase family protein [Paraburkholderia adhaesiva]
MTAGHFRETVDLAHCTRLLNHGPVTIITSQHEGRTNVMAASWAMPLDFSPPKVVVVIDNSTLTRRLIEASGVFGLQVPGVAFARETLAVGTSAGLELDKFAAFRLQTFRAQKIDVPMLSACTAWMECKVIPDESQRYDLILAEVVAAYADRRVYSDNRWHFDDEPGLRTCHYVAGGTFFSTGEPFEVQATQAAVPQP